MTKGRRKFNALLVGLGFLLVMTVAAIWTEFDVEELRVVCTAAGVLFGLFVTGNAAEHFSGRAAVSIPATAAAPVLAVEP